MKSWNTIQDRNCPPEVSAAADAYLLQHQHSIWKKIDHLLAALLIFEWFGCMGLALWRSPLAWNGATSRVHPHLYAAVLLGFCIISLPVVLAYFQPGRTSTRHIIAASQLLMSALLIHLGDGQIEMHFHIFGSLAFVAFYRDWRVLITATCVTAVDHLLRGFYLPESVYGVMHASLWRSGEHIGWVVFEDVFLIGACMQAVREMYGIAKTRALLEHSYQDVERQVTQRTLELKAVQEDLMKAARSAGMAEIATSVLHNVGNVLNSVNVSAMIVTDTLHRSEVASLTKVSEMILQHQPDLAGYFTQDQRGKLIPGFITELATCLNEEQRTVLCEVESLSKGIEHIKKIVAAQQSTAKSSRLQTKVQPASLIESAISMQSAASWSEVQIDRQIVDGPEVMLDEHKVLQILINLVSNAHHAVQVLPPGQRKLTLGFETVQSAGGARLVYRVTDNGQGIDKKNLTRIFSHGFTTKKEGHGFGLHSAANAAREMNGSLSAASEGLNRGATFTLNIPAEPELEDALCRKN